MVAPARRREPRSGKRRSGKCTPLSIKGYKKRKADKPKSAFSSSSSSLFSVTSDISCYNEGMVSRNRTTGGGQNNQEEHIDTIQDSLPLADSLEVSKNSLIQNLKLFHNFWWYFYFMHCCLVNLKSFLVS